MTSNHHLNRRQFVNLTTLSAASSLLPASSLAKETEPAARTYTLAPLPYPVDALEPYIDTKTMEIHHGKHHAAYVAGLNAALIHSPAMASKPLELLLAEIPLATNPALATPLRNHGGGHWNHTFFWSVLSPPNQCGAPSEKLASAIESGFGSMEAFKKSFTEAATKRFGSGWAWLILADGKLKITSTANQDNPLMKGVVPDSDLGTPLLGIDVWEHAYYLHYQNRRADYIGAWWNIVNWKEVSRRLDESKLK